MSRISYARHRLPPEIIQHAVWLYFRFTLSYRDVENLFGGATGARWVFNLLARTQRGAGRLMLTSLSLPEIVEFQAAPS